MDSGVSEETSCSWNGSAVPWDVFSRSSRAARCRRRVAEVCLNAAPPAPGNGNDNDIGGLVAELVDAVALFWQAQAVVLSRKMFPQERRKDQLSLDASADASFHGLVRAIRALVVSAHLFVPADAVVWARAALLLFCAAHVAPVWAAGDGSLSCSALVSLATHAAAIVADIAPDAQTLLTRREHACWTRRCSELERRLFRLVVALERAGSFLGAVFVGKDVAEYEILTRVGYCPSTWGSPAGGSPEVSVLRDLLGGVPFPPERGVVWDPAGAPFPSS